MYLTLFISYPRITVLMLGIFADLNECAAGISVCEDVCINTEGSYRCDCSGLGFKLSWDLASCSGNILVFMASFILTSFPLQVKEVSCSGTE